MTAYALDTWLTDLGLWRGGRLDTDTQRQVELDKINFAQPLVIEGTDFDEKGYRLFHARSKTTYDPAEGVFEDQITLWRHLPCSFTTASEANTQHIISIRGRRNQADNDNGLPEIIPDQIWVGKTPVFNRLNGDNPYDPINVRLINRLVDLNNQLKTHLNEGGPVRDMAKIVNNACDDDPVLKQIIGEDILFRGLSPEGGFDPSLTPAFMHFAQKKNGKMLFTQCDDVRLQSILGFTVNTVEPHKNHSTNRPAVPATQMASGVRFEAQSHFDIDEETGKRSFRITIGPKSPPADAPPTEPFEFLRLDFQRKDDQTVTLERAHFMETQTERFQTFHNQLNIFAAALEANGNFIGKRKYPPFRDIAMQYGLSDELNKMHKPRPLREGGEFLFVPLNGSSMERKFDTFGAGIGGGNMFMQRGLKDDGTLSEVAVVIGFPFEQGGANSEYDGMNPDFTPYWDSIKCFFIDHDHFDHSTIEYYAQQGKLKNKNIVCDERVAYILESRMNKLRVDKSDWPNIITVKEKTNIPIMDDDGNTRMWVQFCPHATRHSALTAGQIITGCYNDDYYNESVSIYNDGFGLTPQGEKFFKDGPMGLATEKGVTVSKLKNIVDLGLHDPTGCESGGYAEQPDTVQYNIEQCMETVKDMGLVFVPFSTNHLEIQKIIESCAKKYIGRDYTFVGANAEIRGRCMNKFGPNPDLDLTDVRLELEDLPEDVLNMARAALENCESATGMTVGNITGCYDIGDEAMEKQWRKIKKELRENIKETGEDPRRDLALFVLTQLAEEGAVTFKQGLNGYNQYNAIQNSNPRISLYSGRSSGTAKEFTDTPSRSLVICTGPTGNASEKSATLPRFAQFWSLFDADNISHKSGYKLDAKNTVFFVTQPAPPVEGMEDAQENLMKTVVKNRDVTIFCAQKNGFKVYNPKQHLPRMMEHFTKLGWSPQYNARTNQLEVRDRTVHVHGHGFEGDLKDMITKIPAHIHEVVHIPNRASFEKAREIILKTGNNTTIEEPDDHLAYRFVKDAKTGQHKLEISDYLMQSYMMINLRRPYGKQYGGIVDMEQVHVMRSDGKGRMAPIDIRTNASGIFIKKSAVKDFNDTFRPDKNRAGPHRRGNNPALAQIQKPGTRPRAPMPFCA